MRVLISAAMQQLSAYTPTDSGGSVFAASNPPVVSGDCQLPTQFGKITMSLYATALLGSPGPAAAASGGAATSTGAPAGAAADPAEDSSRREELEGQECADGKRPSFVHRVLISHYLLQVTLCRELGVVCVCTCAYIHVHMHLRVYIFCLALARSLILPVAARSTAHGNIAFSCFVFRLQVFLVK